jgi:putative addiction module killer protein
MVAEDPHPIASCHEVETRVEDIEDRSPKTRIELTPAAKAWLENLNDKETRDRIHRRLDRLKVGNFGNFKMVRGGVYELREGGYRIYFKKLSEEQVKVLKLGDKHSQDQDIEACQSL